MLNHVIYLVSNTPHFTHCLKSCIYNKLMKYSMLSREFFAYVLTSSSFIPTLVLGMSTKIVLSSDVVFHHVLLLMSCDINHILPEGVGCVWTWDCTVIALSLERTSPFSFSHTICISSR